LKSAKLRDEDIQHTEEAMLQMNQLSVEEIAQRRGELRKMRELMFRAEVNARRVGKIKSKAYRRIKRKEKESTGEKINEDDNEDEEEGVLIRNSEVGAQEAALTLKGKIKSKTHKRIKRKEKESTGEKINEDDNEDEEVLICNSEVEAQEAALTLKGKSKASGIKAFEQRDLVAVAFAGDNVVQVRSCLSSRLLTLVIDRYYYSQNFEEAKSREIASDAPREVDTTIPGWVRLG
jgi:U3 small nucleolar RNA-associated protein 14